MTALIARNPVLFWSIACAVFFVAVGVLAVWAVRRETRPSAELETEFRKYRPWHSVPPGALIAIPVVLLFCFGMTIGFLLPTRYADATGPLLGSFFVFVGWCLMTLRERRRARRSK